jgi:hypothetical protein
VKKKHAFLLSINTFVRSKDRSRFFLAHTELTECHKVRAARAPKAAIRHEPRKAHLARADRAQLCNHRLSFALTLQFSLGSRTCRRFKARQLLEHASALFQSTQLRFRCGTLGVTESILFQLTLDRLCVRAQQRVQITPRGIDLHILLDLELVVFVCIVVIDNKCLLLRLCLLDDLCSSSGACNGFAHLVTKLLARVRACQRARSQQPRTRLFHVARRHHKVIVRAL